MMQSGPTLGGAPWYFMLRPIITLADGKRRAGINNERHGIDPALVVF
jgi:hypothetical protein